MENKQSFLELENSLDNFQIMAVEAKENHPKLDTFLPRRNFSTLETKTEGHNIISQEFLQSNSENMVI